MLRILHAAQAGAQRFAPQSTSSSSSLSLSINAPSLPIPRALTFTLVRMGVDASSAECISSAITRAVTRLKESFETDFSRRQQQLRVHPQACYLADAKFSTIFPATYTTIYNKTVSGWTSYILQEFTPRFLRAQAVHKLRNSKRPFNQLAVPLLERFFSHNAFPSRLEKYDLASASDMDYKQIHVWFQNRRRRFRKDGKELPRPPAKGPLQDFEDGVVNTLLPDDGANDEEDEDEDEDEDAESILDKQVSPSSHLLSRIR
ncbi:hypothetical protein K466DRAFT_476466 [Polyporus arcularius HHB13444]|uniref:Homeobox domain-containing protein n=1 Tax=Polyporus arcularius HHB13444 TaxID=1314778 RepID=A0A5C3PZX7_9APHY|nr:hypothetical protein K466DRAFT_476466 [Polyporus arcularius HHB13444]